MANKWTEKARRRTPAGRICGIGKKRDAIIGKRTQDRKAKIAKRRSYGRIKPNKR